MAKLDKNFFEYGDLAKEEWRELVKSAQDEVGIHFDLENDSPVDQDRVAVDTPEDEFASARDGKPVNDKARFKCELCQAGGDWQQGTHYFRCQGYEGRFGKERFVLIPTKEQGNIHLISEKGKWGPQDSGKDLKRDFDAERKLCWDSLPAMLKARIDAERKKAAKMAMAMKIAADTELAYKKVPMVGTLTMKQKDGNYGILKVPEAFKQAVYDAIWEEGMKYDDIHEKHEAHISVFDDKEMKKIREEHGTIPEDGKEFKYTLKSVETVEPEGWPEMEKVWFVTVESPELEELRKKYGFTPLMKGDHKFHITVAVKPRKVVKKVAAAELARDYSNYLSLLRELLRGLPYEEVVLGRTPWGNIVLFRSLVQSGKRLLVLSGQHGEEIAGPWALLLGLKASRRALEHNAISIVPVCNPYGFASGLRDGIGGEKTNWAMVDGVPRSDGGVEVRTLLDNANLLVPLAADGSINLHEDAKTSGIYMYQLGDLGLPAVRGVLSAGASHIPVRPDGHFVEQDVEYDQKDGVVGNVKDDSFDQFLFQNGVPVTIVTETPINDEVSFLDRVKAGSAMLDEFIAGMTGMGHAVTASEEEVPAWRRGQVERRVDPSQWNSEIEFIRATSEVYRMENGRRGRMPSLSCFLLDNPGWVERQRMMGNGKCREENREARLVTAVTWGVAPTTQHAEVLETLREFFDRCRLYGKHFDDCVEVKFDNDWAGHPRVVLRLYTDFRRYVISAWPWGSNNGRGYMGCTFGNRRSEPSEDWTRGGDLADGDFSFETFQRIINDIAMTEFMVIEEDVMKNPEWQKFVNDQMGLEARPDGTVKMKQAADVSLGVDGLGKSWQKEFPREVDCCRCGAKARVGFVVHEGMSEEDRKGPFVAWLHENKEGGRWLHDVCAVAVYFCRECLEPTALYNQG